MRQIIIITFALLAVLGHGAPTAAQTAPAFKVIVNAKNPATSISRKELGKIFMKKSVSWSGGAAIAPVDQTVGAGARDAFSRTVHGKSAKAVKQYWNQQIYSGKATPPPELSDDAKVVAFVIANQGGIGYVSADAAVGDAKVLTVE